jgi:IAA-amino acid hydrolase
MRFILHRLPKSTHIATPLLSAHGLALSNQTMRTLPLWITSTLCFSSTTSGLPFRNTRGNGGGNDDKLDDSTKVTDAIVVDDGTTRFQVHVPAIKRNAVVETFYSEQDENKASKALLDEIRSKATNLTDFLIQTRRVLHRNPELMYQEEFTSATIQEHLTRMGIAFSTGWAKNIHLQHFDGALGGHGIVADIGTGQPPCVLLRADMDALPIHERTTGVDEFRSRHENRMHACGHDGHTTMLLGAASILKSMEESLPGTVRIMFQPAEEGGAGGKRMTEEGVLTRHPPPSYAFGMHVWPTLPSGSIAARPGPLMAACERFEILIHGVGGHAAMPSLTIDPIVTGAAIIMNLQTIVSRNTNPLEAAVCSITQFDAGSGAFNVIPEAATLKGTIRALSTETLLQLRDRVQHVVNTTAQTYGCNITIEYSPDYYPVTVNDPWLYESFGKGVGSLVSKEGTVREVEPTMGAEDFSFVAEAIPSTFFFIGQGSGTNPPTNFSVHHPHFALDESVLSTGVELHVNLAVRALAKLGKGDGNSRNAAAAG